jgi:predicted phage terminase large subunit-like protein
MTKETEIVLPRLHAAQIKIVSSQARFVVIAAGRRFGKGILGVTEGFRRGILGKKCRWIAPSYASDSFHSGWAMAVNLARQIPGVHIHQMRRAFDFHELGGEWFQFRTAEEIDALRGEGIDFAIFDEAAHVPKLKEIWEQCVRPSLMDRKGGAWWISTPKGFNFFNELYRRGENREEGWESFHFRTLDNPTIDEAEVEALKADMPALVARQEVDAEFVQLAGELFRRENIVLLDEEPEVSYWVRSWDLAFTEKTTSNFSAGAKMAQLKDGMVVIADVVHGRYEWPKAVKVIRETAIQDGPKVAQGVEVVGAQVGMLQTLMADPMLVNLSFQPIEVHKDKVTRALTLVNRSEQKKVAIVRGNWNKKFLDELCSFPSGDQDDQVDACTGGMEMLARHARYGPVQHESVKIPGRTTEISGLGAGYGRKRGLEY